MVKENLKEVLAERQYDRLLQETEENEEMEIVAKLVDSIKASKGLLRWRAVEGLGKVVGKIAARDLNQARETIDWLLLEETGLGGNVPEVLGEIIRNAPDRFADYVPELIGMYKEDNPVYLKRGVVWAIGRIGKQKADLVVSALPILLTGLNDADAEIRGFSAWALGEVGAQDSASALGYRRSDNATVNIYEAGKLWQRTVGSVASDALANIRARA